MHAARMAVLLGLVACDGDEPPIPLSPSEPAQLVVPTGGTHDEDPSLVRGLDGSFTLAFLSDRDAAGNDDLYVMRSVDGITWSLPVRVTRDANPDWYPRLIQTHDGRFRLVWMRANLASPNRWIMTTTSADGITWDPANESMVTDGSADDWAPAVVESSTGRLLVYYSRGGDLYVSQSVDHGATWLSPGRLTAPNAAGMYEVFPAVVERAPGDLLMVWTRYAQAGGSNYWDPSTDLYTAASSDGIVWNGVTPIMQDGFVDSVPNLVPEEGGAGWFVVWTSTSGAPTGRILELPLGAAYPAGAVDCSAARGMAGWSVAATPTASSGVYLGVWVTNTSGSNRLQWRRYAR